ncbi:hypothetical protein ACQ33O_08980 [Ferruginibacter sp. SUN002]|uniref:hypothetical protein n=1 Tax=Ferruginibacter sp. SUN002 TaxID=2937789 RepID=UPI003D360BAF
MKKIAIILLSFFFFCSLVVAQTEGSTKEEYLKKSKNHKTAAWILLGTGAATIITGAIIDANKRENSTYEQDFTGGIIIASGIACTLISVPYFISAGNKKKKAATFALQNNRVVAPFNNAFCYRTQPTLSLSISLGK